MMSREDMLRELELLPVWQLRNPTPAEDEKAVAQEPVAEPELEKPEAQAVERASASQFRYIVSDGALWGFVLPQHHSNEAEALLQNMLKAVSVKIAHDVATADVAHLDQHAVKVIVVMGEEEAKILINTELPLEQLRGKTHQHNDVAVIVTYTPNHLLQNLSDKAKAWEDLCLAKFTIGNL